MRTLLIYCCLGAAVLTAQTPEPQAVATFTLHNSTPVGLNEIPVILRTVCSIPKVLVDTAAASVTVTDTAEHLALAAWLLQALDQPPGSGTTPPSPYLVAGTADYIRIFHLSHGTALTAMSEILTIIRTVGDVQLVFQYSALSDIVVRAHSDELAFIDYLVRYTDVDRADTNSAPEFSYRPPGRQPGQFLPEVTAGVFYLKNAGTPQTMAETLTALRTNVGIQKVFQATAPSAIALQSDPASFAAAKWLIGALDVQAPPLSVREFVWPSGIMLGKVIHVVYQAQGTSAQAMSAKLALARSAVRQAWLNTTVPAFVFTGTPEEVTAAERLVADPK